MLEVIKSIVVKWDLIGLMEFAPLDEYDDECMMIYIKYIQSYESLGKIIYDVFNDSFGEAFQEDYSKCMQIAMTIESKIFGRK